MKTLLVSFACLVMIVHQNVVAEGTNSSAILMPATVGMPVPCQPRGKSLREIVLSCPRIIELTHPTRNWSFQTNGAFSVIDCANCKQSKFGSGKWSVTPEGFLHIDGTVEGGRVLQLTVIGADVLTVTNRNGDFTSIDHEVRFKYSTEAK